MLCIFGFLIIAMGVGFFYFSFSLPILLFFHSANQNLRDGMKNGQNNYTIGDVNYEEITQLWDDVQRRLRCCGVQGYMDWENTTFSKGEKVPDSCCKTTEGCRNMVFSPDERNMSSEVSNIHKNGCFGVLITGLRRDIALVGIGFMSLFIAQLLTCILAFWQMLRSIRSKYTLN